MNLLLEEEIELIPDLRINSIKHLKIWAGEIILVLGYK